MSNWATTFSNFSSKITEITNTAKNSVTGSAASFEEIPATNDLRSDLISTNKDRKKKALSILIKCIAIGRDMSELFPEVLNCIQSESLVLKKMVYVYLGHNCKKHPDLIILAINTFCKDCEHINPIIRACAIRTIGNLQTESTIEYIIKPLKKLILDSDSYVRKAAILTVGKLYNLQPAQFNDHGIIELLYQRLTADESSAIVIVNIVSVLANLTNHTIKIDSTCMKSLVVLLAECTEGGQMLILDTLRTYYTPTNEREAMSMIDKVVCRLTHNNTGVVISASGLIIKYLESIDKSSDHFYTNLNRVLSSLNSLVSSESNEITYVILKNLKLMYCKYVITEKRNITIFTNVSQYYVRATDPIYIISEKLDILCILLISRDEPTNWPRDPIIKEFIEYSNEIYPDLVRLAVRCIGRIITCGKETQGLLNILIDVLISSSQGNLYKSEALKVVSDILLVRPDLKVMNEAFFAFIFNFYLIPSNPGDLQSVFNLGRMLIKDVYKLNAVTAVKLSNSIEDPNDYEPISFGEVIIRYLKSHTVQPNELSAATACLAACCIEGSNENITDYYDELLSSLLDPITLNKVQKYKYLIQSGTKVLKEVLNTRPEPQCYKSLFYLDSSHVASMPEIFGSISSVLEEADCIYSLPKSVNSLTASAR